MSRWLSDATTISSSSGSSGSSVDISGLTTSISSLESQLTDLKGSGYTSGSVKANADAVSELTTKVDGSFDTVSFNNSSRELTLTQNDNASSSVTIPEKDTTAIETDISRIKGTGWTNNTSSISNIEGELGLMKDGNNGSTWFEGYSLVDNKNFSIGISNALNAAVESLTNRLNAVDTNYEWNFEKSIDDGTLTSLNGSLSTTNSNRQTGLFNGGTIISTGSSASGIKIEQNGNDKSSGSSLALMTYNNPMVPLDFIKENVRRITYPFKFEIEWTSHEDYTSNHGIYLAFMLGYSYSKTVSETHNILKVQFRDQGLRIENFHQQFISSNNLHAYPQTTRYKLECVYGIGSRMKICLYKYNPAAGESVYTLDEEIANLDFDAWHVTAKSNNNNVDIYSGIVPFHDSSTFQSSLSIGAFARYPRTIGSYDFANQVESRNGIKSATFHRIYLGSGEPSSKTPHIVPTNFGNTKSDRSYIFSTTNDGLSISTGNNRWPNSKPTNRLYDKFWTNQAMFSGYGTLSYEVTTENLIASNMAYNWTIAFVNQPVYNINNGKNLTGTNNTPHQLRQHFEDYDTMVDADGFAWNALFRTSIDAFKMVGVNGEEYKKPAVSALWISRGYTGDGDVFQYMDDKDGSAFDDKLNKEKVLCEFQDLGSGTDDPDAYKRRARITYTISEYYPTGNTSDAPSDLLDLVRIKIENLNPPASASGYTNGLKDNTGEHTTTGICEATRVVHKNSKWYMIGALGHDDQVVEKLKFVPS